MSDSNILDINPYVALGAWSCDRMSSVHLSVRPSVCDCDIVGSGPHTLEIFETNCTDN